MTTKSARFDDLLSSRARIGWGAPVAARRPVDSPLYEFGGGFPDPASFPYDDIVDATARMIKAEGAEALTYGDPQGYRGLCELVCHKYNLFEGLKVRPENLIISEAPTSKSASLRADSSSGSSCPPAPIPRGSPSERGRARVQYTAGTAFFINGGSEGFIRLAYSYEAPERCHEGARILAKAILDSR